MLTKLFKKRRGIFLIVMIGLIAGGIAVSVLPIKLYPTMRKPWVFINVPHPGYNAEDFKDMCSDLIENQLKLLKDLDHIESTYGNNRSYFRVEFKWNISYDEAKQRAQSAMDAVKSGLPDEAQNYSVNFWRSDTTFLTIAVYADKMSQKELYQTVEPVLKTEISKVQDAESIEVVNVEDLSARIYLQPDALFSYGLTVEQVVNSIRNGYKNISIGTFSDLNNQFNLRIKRGIDTLFDIENIMVSYTGSKKILLKDVALVDVKYGLPNTAFRLNGKKSVIIFVTPKVDGNLKKLSGDMKKVLRDIKKDLPEGIRFEFVIDPAQFIDRAIRNVIEAALVGSVLAFLVILFLMGDVKNSFIIFLSIPASVIFSFILMYFFDVTVNIISLGGITLAVGMIVDDSIVVIENIDRHRLNAVKNGKVYNFIEIIILSIDEIRGAVIGSTITRVCVFLPLSFTSPLAYGILGDLAKTVIFTLLCSMVVALFMIPLIAFYMFRQKDGSTILAKESFFHQFSVRTINRVISVYQHFLRIILGSRRNSYLFIGGAFFLLVFLIAFIAPRITREIVATPRSDAIAIRFENALTDDQDELFQKITPIEEDLLNNYKGKVIRVFTRVNRSNRGSFIITLKSSWYLNSMLDTLKKKYTSNPEWTYDITSWDPSSLPIPMTYDLHIRVNGQDRVKILALQEEIIDLIRKSDLYRDIFSSPSTMTSREVIMKPRIEVINDFPDLNLNRFATMTRVLLNGTNVISMNVDNEKMNINLNYPTGSVTSIENIENYLIPYNGKAIPLKHFFDFEKSRGIGQIRFDDGIETYNIFAFMKRETPRYKRDELERKTKELIKEKIKLPQGYSITFMNTQTLINDAINSLIIAIITSILLIYIVLGIEFNSLLIPLIILVTIPLGFIGVIICLFVFRSTISLNSMLGIILLGGTVVSNAIIMIDFYLKKQKLNQNLQETLIAIAGLRFRPIMITSLTGILGMLPIALAIGDGANIIQPLGITVSGGLAVSTFFTLFMVPCILNLIKLKNKELTPDVKP